MKQISRMLSVVSEVAFMKLSKEDSANKHRNTSKEMLAETSKCLKSIAAVQSFQYGSNACRPNELQACADWIRKSCTPSEVEVNLTVRKCQEEAGLPHETSWYWMVLALALCWTQMSLDHVLHHRVVWDVHAFNSHVNEEHSSVRRNETCQKKQSYIIYHIMKHILGTAVGPTLYSSFQHWMEARIKEKFGIKRKQYCISRKSESIQKLCWGHAFLSIDAPKRLL